MLNHEKRYTGDIVDVITNHFNLYEGDLRHYARIIFSAPNIHHGYHGLRHMLHVTWVCYQACEYYSRLALLSRWSQRNLLIAAMFHDFGHSGQSGNDGDNIRLAIKIMRESLAPEDIDRAEHIAAIIRVTEYPHQDTGRIESLEQSIIKDADMSQSFGTAWIGDILAGLGSEQGKTPVEMLNQQQKFLQTVHFSTDFGKIFFGREAIEAKVKETEELIQILSL